MADNIILQWTIKSTSILLKEFLFSEWCDPYYSSLHLSSSLCLFSQLAISAKHNTVGMWNVIFWESDANLWAGRWCFLMCCILPALSTSSGLITGTRWAICCEQVCVAFLSVQKRFAFKTSVMTCCVKKQASSLPFICFLPLLHCGSYTGGLGAWLEKKVNSKLKRCNGRRAIAIEKREKTKQVKKKKEPWFSLSNHKHQNPPAGQPINLNWYLFINIFIKIK